MPPLQTDQLSVSALRPITVDEYHAMGRAGVFRPEERVELLDGHLLPMSPVAGPHFVVTNRLNGHFSRYVYQASADLAQVSVQAPVRLNDQSEPEPDVTLLRPDYDDRIAVAGAGDVLLIIEVSASTLAFDQGIKRSRYAAAGIPEVWIVSVDGLWVEAAHAPDGNTYTEIRRFALGDARPLVPQSLPSLPPLDLAVLFRGMAKRAAIVSRRTSVLHLGDTLARCVGDNDEVRRRLIVRCRQVIPEAIRCRSVRSAPLGVQPRPRSVAPFGSPCGVAMPE